MKQGFDKMTIGELHILLKIYLKNHRDKGSACYILSPGATSWVASDEMKFNFPRQMSTMSKSQTSGVIFVSGGLDSEHGQTIEYLDRYVLELVGTSEPAF